MNIFLRRIPANTKHAEISEFVSPALNRGFFRKSGRIINVEILALQDTRIGTIEYHGLVTLDSEAAVQSAVRGLKNRRLNGRLVVVRPYYHRSWYNDPRQQQNTVNENILEKRRGDRRRGQYLQIIKNVSDRFNSEDDFFRTLNHQQFLTTFMVPGDFEEALTKFIAEFGEEEEEEESDDELIPPSPRHKAIRLLSEQEGDQRTYSFQIHAEKKDSLALLEKLKTEFSGSGIQYWIVPVVEKGEL
ncbi:MAG: RNA-binding protein [Methylococcaceae bacterium]|nr:RNA-binding protein [Methylococcaceae bacterium]